VKAFISLAMGLTLNVALTSPPTSDDVVELISHVKQIPASQLDPTLPSIPLEKWVALQVGVRATVAWAVRTGYPGHRSVEADLSFQGRPGLVIVIAVGKSTARFQSLALVRKDEYLEWPRLRDLPAALQRAENPIVAVSAHSESENATFEIRPHVLTTGGPADNSKFVGDVVKQTAMKWVDLAPSKTRPPQLKTGTVVVAFVLHRDGKVTDMVLKKSSGDEELDQAAWQSIMRCGPYFGAQFEQDKEPLVSVAGLQCAPVRSAGRN
jgi:TonB family protein